MKKAKYLLVALLILSFALSAVSCYMISAQSMNKLKGTYKLTHYTYTQKYERKEGYSPKTIDYVNDEKYLYEDYLVITGSSVGYYVHKDANGNNYVKEVNISYEYSQDEANAISYVTFKDSLTTDIESGINRVGVNKNSLNYNKSAFDYTEIITKRPMRSESLSIKWEKVDRSTDLSYTNSQTGELKYSDYHAFGLRGIYELSVPMDIESGTLTESSHLYFYYVIDPAKDAEKAYLCCALKDSPDNQVYYIVAVWRGDDTWNTVYVNDRQFTASQWGTYYETTSDGVRQTMTCVSRDISDTALKALVDNKLAYQQ